MNTNKHLGLFSIYLTSLFFFSCAPVRFQKASVNVITACKGSVCATGGKDIKCDPKINSSLTTFTYGNVAALPGITSNCAPSDVDYNWVIKKADTSVVSATVPGLSGANPASVDFTVLGPGAYYVYLTATKTGASYNAYVATKDRKSVV